MKFTQPMTASDSAAKEINDLWHMARSLTAIAVRHSVSQLYLAKGMVRVKLSVPYLSGDMWRSDVRYVHPDAVARIELIGIQLAKIKTRINKLKIEAKRENNKLALSPLDTPSRLSPSIDIEVTNNYFNITFNPPTHSSLVAKFKYVLFKSAQNTSQSITWVPINDASSYKWQSKLSHVNWSKIEMLTKQINSVLHLEGADQINSAITVDSGWASFSCPTVTLISNSCKVVVYVILNKSCSAILGDSVVIMSKKEASVSTVATSSYDVMKDYL